MFKPRSLILAVVASLAVAAAPPPAAPPRPYPLRYCPISGEELGSMGAPVVKIYEGREVRFCCKSCIKKFEAEAPEYWSQIDRDIADDQRMHFTLETCIVSGDALTTHGDPVEVVIDNRLVLVCSSECAEKLRRDPTTYGAALDAAIAESQRADYPLTVCPVSGERLGEQGAPVDIVFENRLVRLCSEKCVAKFQVNPRKFMLVLDAAYADAQRPTYPTDTCPVSGDKLGSQGEPVEIVAGDRLVRLCGDECLSEFRRDPARYLAALREPER
ncbi:MAG: hypothetical protein IPJ41_13240 [Phycisphaerales bacterium]|nr:hypothetical protein [Phycisphaerales bacterium]